MQSLVCVFVRLAFHATGLHYYLYFFPEQDTMRASGMHVTIGWRMAMMTESG